MYDDIVKGLSSSDPKVKERSADEVTDVAKNMPEREVQAIARSLVEQVLAVKIDSFREAALNALCELQEWHLVSPDVLALLASLDRTTIVGSQKEHLANLLRSAGSGPGVD